MAYLRQSTQKLDRISYDMLVKWLPNAEFSTKDDAPHMRLCRNAPDHILHPFQKEVGLLKIFFLFFFSLGKLLTLEART